MDKGIYIIIKHDFDSLENNYANAICERFVGYVEAKNEEKVKEIIEKIEKKTKKYHTWGGDFPTYCYKKIEKYEQS